MENKKYLVVQIGCIECGVDSYPIGIYDNLKEAIEAKENHPDIWESEHGEGYVDIWLIDGNKVKVLDY